MNDLYFQGSADASQQYRPTAAVETRDQISAAVNGNLADMIKNATLYKVDVQAPGTFFYPEYSVAGLINRRP